MARHAAGPSSGAEIEYRMLGTLEARAGERAVAPGGSRTGALLALLLLRAGEVVPAERIVEELWSGARPGSATGYAKVHVSRLRKALLPILAGGDATAIVETRAPGYVLVAQPGQIDACRFEALVADGRGMLAAGDPAGAARRLRCALDLWHEPLAEFTYEPFAQAETARLRELHIEAIEHRVEAELALGRHGELVGELESLVVEHPYRERVHGQLILALYRSGRQADALAAYRGARRTLCDEIGIEPCNELRSLEQAVLAQDPRIDWTPSASASAASQRLTAPRPHPAAAFPAALVGMVPARFVDRVGELARLRQAWERAGAGRPRTVLVSGEPGIGKTRLAARLAELAHADGARVLYGRCDEDVAQAYGPWIEALAPLDQPGGELAAVTGERPRLFTAVREALTRAAEQCPLVLVLDDLHLADADTVALLRHVVRVADPLPLLIVAAYRRCELDEAHPLADAFAALHRAGAEHVAMTGMGERETAELVLAAGAHREAARTIARVSGGNPYFALELAGHPGIGGADGTAPVTDVLPDGVRAVVGARVRRLGASVAALLRTAAAMGQEFELELLEHVAEAAPGDALAGLEAAVHAGLLCEPAGSPGRFRFTHEVVRWTLCGELGAARRARLLRRASHVPALPAPGPAPQAA